MSKPFSFPDVNWFCGQAYDPQTGYDLSYFRPTVDETVRVQGLPSQDVRVVIYIISVVFIIIWISVNEYGLIYICFELLMIVNYDSNYCFLLLERVV